MINWIAWWYRPDRDGTGESVAANLAGMAVDSVLHERQASLSLGFNLRVFVLRKL
jgi:hypothetical protein